MAEVLGRLDQAVLRAVVGRGKDAYGRAILKEAQSRLHRALAAGAVYATLDRLEQKGLISSRLGSGTAVRAGRPRRYYSLEHAGGRALNESKAAVDNIWDGLRWPLKGGT